MEHQGYYRTPSINGSTIVFVCEDDLWSVDAGGGIAAQLLLDRHEIISQQIENFFCRRYRQCAQNSPGLVLYRTMLLLLPLANAKIGASAIRITPLQPMGPR